MRFVLLDEAEFSIPGWLLRFHSGYCYHLLKIFQHHWHFKLCSFFTATKYQRLHLKSDWIEFFQSPNQLDVLSVARQYSIAISCLMRTNQLLSTSSSDINLSEHSVHQFYTRWYLVVHVAQCSPECISAACRRWFRWHCWEATSFKCRSKN